MTDQQRLPYLILEVANVHGGDYDHILDLVGKVETIDHAYKGVKFQPLKPDLIALPDYEWYPTYQELYFKPEQWKEIITCAKQSAGVWIDLFDAYGVQVVQENLLELAGIKLQASVLENNEILLALTEIDISHLKLIVNVSGYELSEIETFLEKFSVLNAAETIIQLGFQSYPTDIEDTGLQKIAVLATAFPEYPLCIADHSPAEHGVSENVPVWAMLMGCSFIEKHFCISREVSKYDAFSALTPVEINKMMALVRNAVSASNGAFIGKAEKKYLQSTVQIPVSAGHLNKGQLVSQHDLRFRRTAASGIDWKTIELLQNSFQVLKTSCEKNETFNQTDFCQAKIAAIVACRMKSSRLKQKALLPLAGIPSVERCLMNCFEMPFVDDVILATSTLEEDAVLGDYLCNDQAKFWQGDPDDVIARYLGACDAYSVDVIVRVTADCPVVSPEITEILIKNHFSSGADYTAAEDIAVGTSVEIYNVEALQRVIELVGRAEHSEYMTWYMQNNPDIFKINMVRLPEDYIREYRLTLDYQEDFDMFERLFTRLKEEGLNAGLFNVFKVLDEMPEIPEINNHISLVYKTDQKLIQMLNEKTRIRLADKPVS